MQRQIRLIFVITICILMLPALCFILLGSFVNGYVPFILLSSFMLILFTREKYINKIISIYKYSPFKYFIYFFIWSLFTIVLSIFFHHFYLKTFINSVLGGLLCSVILPMLFIIVLIPKYFPMKFFIKLLFGFSFFVFLFTVLEFIVYNFNIIILKPLIMFFANKRYIIGAYDTSFKVIAGGIYRTQSIFEEPSFLGYYTWIISPVIYYLSASKYRIFNNKYINKILKKSIVPLMWFSIISCQSPIFLIFFVITSLFYYVKQKLNFVKLKLHIILLCSIFIIFIVTFLLLNGFAFLDLEGSFLSRINHTFNNLSNFSDFVEAEPSLATRIIIIINAIQIGIEHLITGIGYGNLSMYIADSLSKTSLPLTIELMSFVNENKSAPASTIFIKVFSETGIIGVLLFYKFLFVLKKSLKNSLKYFKGITVDFVQSLYYFITLFILSTFYSSNFNDAYIWCIIGCSIAIILQASTYRKRFLNNNMKGEQFEY